MSNFARAVATGVSNTKGEKRLLPLSAIRVDEQAQPRAALQEDRITEYAEDMKRRDRFPPLVVFEDAEGVFWLADGFHRYHAAIEAKWETIQCEVRSGGLREAILCGCGANAAHGLRRTNEDKRQAVTRLLKDAEWGKWSDREIGRRCNVTHELVGRLREQLKPVTGVSASEPVTSNVGSERTYVDKHGNTVTMRTGNIGRSRAPNPESEKGSSEQERQPQSALSPQESPEPASEPLRANVSNIELPAPESAAKEPMGSDPGSPPDPWAGQRSAVRGFIRGLANLKDVDFGPVAATMPLEQLREASDEMDEAMDVAFAWSAALQQAIESATEPEEEPPLAGRGVREGGL
jgi:hypothetical protein